LSIEDKNANQKLHEKRIQFQMEDKQATKKTDTVKKVVKGASKAWSQLNKN